MVGIYYPNTTGMVLAVTDKRIALNNIAIAMSQRKGASRFQEQVIADDVTTGFYRYNFNFTVASVKNITLYNRI